MTAASLTLTKGQGHTTRSKVTDVEVSAFSKCFLFCPFFNFQALIAKSDTFIWLDASSRFYPTVNFEEFFQKLDDKGLMFDIRSSGGSVSTRSHETMLKV